MNQPILEMLLNAGTAARIVLVLLLVISIVTWAIVASRLQLLKKARSADGAFLKKFSTLQSLTELESPNTAHNNSPKAMLAEYGIKELNRLSTDLKRFALADDRSLFLQMQFSIINERLNAGFSRIVSVYDRKIYLLAMASSIAPPHSPPRPRPCPKRQSARSTGAATPIVL